MGYIAQFRVMNPHQKPFLNRQQKPDYYTAISKIYTRNLNQRHIPKRGQKIKIAKKVQVGKDQEKAQSEKDSHSKNRGGKKPN